jgi:hypothetical protein
MTTPKRKKKQSDSRNADTRFINNLKRENEEMRSLRSLEIRDRERRARERARAELEAVIRANA